MTARSTKVKHTMMNEQRPEKSRNPRPTIGLLTDEGMTIFNFALGSGVADVVRQRDANLLIFPGNPLKSPYGFQTQVNILYDLIDSANVDGLIILAGALAHYVDAEEVNRFCQRYHPLPMVSVALPLRGIPSVLTDSYRGMREAVTHLVEVHGYRRIAFIRGPAGHPEAEERYRAYVDVLAEHGIPFDAHLIAPGEFAYPASVRAGREAIYLLLNQRRLDFEAIVAANDGLAFGALEALQARGLYAPDEVAVIGFDDNAEAKAITPPLTTARQPMYEVGCQAAEMIFAQLEGQEVPSLISIAPELIVRQSCGCLHPRVAEVALVPPASTDETIEVALAREREKILAKMIQSSRADDLAPDWAERLLDALAKDLQEESSGSFLSALDRTLRQAAASGTRLVTWQAVISVLRRYTLPHLQEDGNRFRAESLFQQARVFIGESARRSRVLQELETEQQNQMLREISQVLITTFHIEELTDVISRELPRLDIPSCYLSLYKRRSDPSESEIGNVPQESQLILAYDETGRARLEGDDQLFPTVQLLPEGLLPYNRRYTMTVEPLFFRQDQIGFVLFEAGPRDAAICKALRGHLGSALQGALLLQQAENRAVQLQTAAEVSQAASSILDPDELIQQTVELARERFDLYYAGLFLVDQTGQWTDEPGRWAVLRAGTGEAGQEMLARGHKLEIGGSSMIGWCVANKEARIALDVGEEAVRFDNPLLPETRSELALPLTSRGQAIGALTIQSSQEAAFSEEDISLLRTMADQVANAIANAWLYDQAQKELAERQRTEEALQKANEELEGYANTLERRAVQLQAAADVAREATAILDVHRLLDEAVRRVSDRFGFYHAGVFLVDEAGKYAILRAASSEGGQRMLQRGHKLSVGKVGIVGYVTATGEPRIALDVGKDATFFDNPDLPNTRSEMALPLTVRGNVIGALDVQSIEPSAFTEEDITILQTMADQLAVAIANARLVERTEAQLHELNLLQGKLSAAAWARLAEAERSVGYIYDRVDVLPVEEPPVSEFDTILEQGKTFAVCNPEQSEAALATPLKIREQLIGALGVQETDEAREWGREEIELLEAVSNQVSRALEDARLFEETQAALAETEALYHASRRLLSATAVGEVLQSALESFADTGVDFCLILRFGEMEGQDAEVRAAWSAQGDPATPPGTRIPYEMLAPFIESRPLQTAVVTDPDRDERVNPAFGQFLEAINVESFVAVPTEVMGEPYGAFVTGHTSRTSYGETIIRRYEAISAQAAVAIENLRLLEESQRTANQLAAAAEVARSATAILDVGQLLDETVQLISKRFDFYHAGIFLLDEAGEYAVLRAASSEGGSRMLARKHRLKVGEVGIVGTVAATGEPRIAHDVGTDAAFFNNPDLPDTRSEMALPLLARGRVIGALDVQSVKEAAFTEEDIAILKTMADQLATAISNARLFRQVRADAKRRALVNEVIQAAASSLDIEEMMERAGGVIASRLDMPCAIFKWDGGEETLIPVAIHDFTGANVTPDEPTSLVAETDSRMFRAVQTRQLQVVSDISSHVYGAAAKLAQRLNLQDVAYAPLATRKQTLGLVALGRHQGHPPLDEGELSFLEVASANLGVAMENAMLYQEAVETAERLAEVDRLKSQFLANMSHELRTPLNSIIGFSRVILKGIDGPLTDMQRTDLQAVYNSGQHLLGLINDILDLSKIEAGKMELAFEDVDLEELIKGVMSTAIALVKGKSVELQHEIPPDLPTIWGDTRRLRQVLLNLVSNAAKFTEDGFIRVEAGVRDDEVILSVVDSGIGIPPEKQASIFEPFTQVDGSSTRRAGGTGLGLSICKSFVEMHGGDMWLESAIGMGSTFYFSLPIEGPSPEIEEGEGEEEGKEIKAQPAEEIEEETGKLVLCVDDDEGVITLFRRYLGKRGYRVVGVTDPAQVLEKARKLHPHAITLDVMMPEKDGWQVIQELKADPETTGIPVVMCTIVAEKGRGMSLGATDYLIKPILEQDLVAALERLDREAGRHCVLVVDDNPEDRQLLCRMIESQEGYEVIEASGGPEAIRLVQQEQPHLIILDLMMPEMDGFAVLEAVKANKATRSIPIIVVTAKELTENDLERLNHHAEALVQKGLLKRDELLEDVAAALQRMGRHLVENPPEDQPEDQKGG